MVHNAFNDQIAVPSIYKIPTEGKLNQTIAHDTEHKTSINHGFVHTHGLRKGTEITSATTGVGVQLISNAGNNQITYHLLFDD